MQPSPIDRDQKKRRDRLAERCPQCGSTARKGSLTSWIFSGPSNSSTFNCDCQSNSQQPQTTTRNRQSIGKLSGSSSSSSGSGGSISGISGVSETAPVDLQNDKFLNSRFRIGDLIGAGGMGSVYKAEDASLKSTFAIKVLRPELAKDPIACSRFEHEANSVQNLTHPNIVAVYEYGISQSGAPYIVMDYVEGKSLEEILEENVFLEPNRVIDLFIQVTDAVAHAHKKRVIHRDIKPNNIIVKSSNGTDIVKIVDFGIAKVMPEADKTTQGLTQTGELFGSPSYMSPEQCTGKRLDGRSDIYAIGCVMYEALSGKPPFRGENAIQTILHHINDEPEDLSKRSSNLNIPDQLSYVVMRCLEKQATNRYQSAEELKADLEAIRDQRAIKKIQPKRAQTPTQVIASLSFRSGIYMLVASIALFGCLFAISLEVSRAGKVSNLSRTEQWSQADLRGQESFDKGDYKKAQEEFDNALEVAQSAQNTSPELLKASLNEQLDLARATGKTQDIPLLQRRIADQNEDTKHFVRLEQQLDDALAGRYDDRDKSFFDDLANSSNDQFAGLNELDQSEIAQRIVDKTTKMVREKVGYDSEPMMRCLHNIGYLSHSFDGDAIRAKKFYEEALALERKMLPKEHVRTANTLLMLARLSLQQGNYAKDEVSKLLKESLEMYRHLTGPASKDVARVRYHLALLYFQTNRLDEANSEIEAAISIFKNLKEPEPGQVGRCYALLARISQNSDDYVQAIKLLESETNKEYPLMISTFLQYSKAISGNKPEIARTMLTRALAMTERQKQPERERIQWQIQNQLGQVNGMLGDGSKSESAYKTALSLAKNTFGANSEQVFETLTGLAIMHDDRGEVSQARDFYQQATNLANQPDIVIAKSKLGQLKFRFQHFLKNQRTAAKVD